MARMLLPLFVFSCVMCLCTTNRLDQLECQTEDIYKKLAHLNSYVAECLGTEQDSATTPDKNVHDELNRSTCSLKKDIGFIKDSIASVINNVTNMEMELKTSMQELDTSVKEIRDEILQALRVSMTSCCQTSTPRPTTTPRTTEPSTVTTSTPRPTTTPRTTEQTTVTTTTSPVQLPSCMELHHNQSGVYTIYPLPSNQPVKVYCDMDTEGGGWTVFQRRQDGSVDFNRTWADYASGFGNVSGEFWLGNDLISSLASQGPHELRIDLKDYRKSSAYAKYNSFQLSPSDGNYKLKVGGFSGDAGDSLSYHSGLAFSTWDRDHDRRPGVNCAIYCGGAWWYDRCGDYSNLNGRYGHGHSWRGMVWVGLKRRYAPMRWTEMKLRARPQALP